VAYKFPGFFISLRRYTVIGNQLLISNDRNRVRRVVLGLSQDGACTDLLENLSVNSLKRDLSNALTFNPPLFSLVNTFKGRSVAIFSEAHPPPSCDSPLKFKVSQRLLVHKISMAHTALAAAFVLFMQGLKKAQ
jgi:hypothetical protein